ncbi:MAG: hypothetical protein WCJ30_12460, partial [Deltaproteobacteria bacterium]
MIVRRPPLVVLAVAMSHCASTAHGGDSGDVVLEADVLFDRGPDIAQDIPTPPVDVPVDASPEATPLDVVFIDDAATTATCGTAPVGRSMCEGLCGNGTVD